MSNASNATSGSSGSYYQLLMEATRKLEEVVDALVPPTDEQDTTAASASNADEKTAEQQAGFQVETPADRAKRLIDQHLDTLYRHRSDPVFTEMKATSQRLSRATHQDMKRMQELEAKSLDLDGEFESSRQVVDSVERHILRAIYQYREKLNKMRRRGGVAEGHSASADTGAEPYHGFGSSAADRGDEVDMDKIKLELTVAVLQAKVHELEDALVATGAHTDVHPKRLKFEEKVAGLLKIVTGLQDQLVDARLARVRLEEERQTLVYEKNQMAQQLQEIILSMPPQSDATGQAAQGDALEAYLPARPGTAPAPGPGPVPAPSSAVASAPAPARDMEVARLAAKAAAAEEEADRLATEKTDLQKRVRLLEAEVQKVLTLLSTDRETWKQNNRKHRQELEAASRGQRLQRLSSVGVAAAALLSKLGDDEGRERLKPLT